MAETIKLKYKVKQGNPVFGETLTVMLLSYRFVMTQIVIKEVHNSTSFTVGKSGSLPRAAYDIETLQ